VIRVLLSKFIIHNCLVGIVIAETPTFYPDSGIALALTENEMYTQTFQDGGKMPVSYPAVASSGTSRDDDRTTSGYTPLPRIGMPNGNASKIASTKSSSPNGSGFIIGTRMKFQNPYGACNFIVTWDGENVSDVLDAIRYARESGDRFIQDKLIEYILNIPLRHPRPLDIPAFVGRPIWAVDKHGRALVGMPGSESIVSVEWLRQQAHHA